MGASYFTLYFTVNATMNMSQDVCRLCLKRTLTKFPIFNGADKLDVKIKSCLPELTLEHDDLPKEVCNDCLEKLDSHYDFQIFCYRNEKVLLQQLPGNKDAEVKRESKNGEQLVTFKTPEESHDNRRSWSNSSVICIDDGNNGSHCEKINNIPTGILVTKKNVVFDVQEENYDKEVDKPVFKCTICRNIFLKKKQFQKHMIEHMEKQIEFCEKKAFIYDEHKMETKEEKKLNLAGTKPFSCIACGKKFKRAYSLQIHIMKPHRCPVCNKIFPRPLDFKKHRWEHIGKKPYSCNICGAQFSLSSKLSKHILTHSQKIKPGEIMFYGGMLIKLDDLLPKNVCGDCVRKLDSSYDFQCACYRVEKELLEKLRESQQALLPVIKMEEDIIDDEMTIKIPEESGHDEDKKLSCAILNENFLNSDDDNGVSSTSTIDPLALSPGIGMKKRTCQDNFRTGVSSEVPKVSEDMGDQLQCVLCGEVFYQKESLWEHIKSHIAPTTLLQKDSELISNQRKTHGRKIKILNIKTLNVNNISPDNKKNVSQEIYSCNNCNKEFVDKANLYKHIMSHFEGDKFICRVCKRQFLEKYRLIRHEKTHLYSSPKCDKNGSTLIKNYLCSLCGKVFLRPSDLKYHQTSHTGEKPFSCKICDKKFTLPSSLNIHIRRHKNDRPHSCTFCDRQFIRSQELKIHLMDHTGEKPHQCPVCDKKFKRSSDLKSHSMIHTTTKPHSCDECYKTFSRPSQLKVHARSHLEEKPYSCEGCDKKFTRASSLKIHSMIHTGERPHRCGVCDKLFARASDLKYHSVSHTGEKPYTCNICDKRFSLPSSVRRHNNLVHGATN